MRIFLSIILSFALTVSANPFIGMASSSVVTAGGGGSPAAFTDDFNRADGAALGTDWTEAEGEGEIASSRYRIATGSFGEVATIHNTSTGSLTQYARFTLGPNNQYPWFILRYGFIFALLRLPVRRRGGNARMVSVR